MLFIGSTIIIGTLGYLITPDSTPFANDQHVEIAAKKPGFQVEMLRVRKNEKVKPRSIFQKMLYGEKSRYRSIPIDGYSVDSLSIIVKEYTGSEEIKARDFKFSIPDVIYPIDEEQSIVFNNDYIQIPLIDGSIKEASLNQLKGRLIEDHIITKTYYLGSDRFGRDILSMLLIGIRVSLSVGFISVFISLIIGITLGALAGFFRGWVDHLIVWFINVIWSIPTLLMVIAITFALGKGFWQVFIAVGLTMWVEVARVVRGQILSFREREFVEAGKALGFSNFRIIFRHILPNVLGPVIVISSANFATAILLEAGLSFLGIGVQPPMPSWGTMIKENYSYIILDAAHLAIFPGLAIMIMVLAFMIMGNALRNALDVKVVH